jgi:hypothetical protein
MAVPVVTGINHRISKEGIILLAARTVVLVQMYCSCVLVYPNARVPAWFRCSLTYLKGEV